MMKLFLRYIVLLPAMIAVALSCQREESIGDIAKSTFAVSFAEGSIVDDLGLPADDYIAVSGADAPLKLKNGKASGKVMQSEEYYAVYPASAYLSFRSDKVFEVVRLSVISIAILKSSPHTMIGV